MILKLSDIMDYTLYECAQEKVLVTKEWKLIENYADLEALRFNQEVDLSLSERIEDKEATVAPLLLIPIIENAFKYGLIESVSRPLIRINLEVNNGTLTLKTKNSSSNKTKRKPNHKNGIGLENLRKRLSIEYPSRHQLIIDESEEYFSVTLTIVL